MALLEEGDEVGSAVGLAAGELPWVSVKHEGKGKQPLIPVSVTCVGSPDAGREIPQETRSFAF